jgi:hypothetical protein
MIKNILFPLALLLSPVAFAQPCAAPVTAGSASNIFTNIRNGTDPLVADKDLNAVLFIHRNNATAFGGSSGNMRYDLSTDGGNTFTNDQGVVNPLLTRQARYPQAAIYNPVGNTVAANAYLSYYAPTLNGANFEGYVSGVRQLNGSGNTENYNQAASLQTLIPHDITKGAPGTFWSIDAVWSGTAITGFRILKGVWNGNNDIVWSINTTLTPAFNTAFNGFAQVGDYHIAFDPTGQIGWISVLTHLTPGPTPNSLYPVFWRTTDGGNTWSSAEQIDVGQFTCISSNIAIGNFASTTFESDLTVDAAGEPHLLTTIANGNNGYAIFFAQWHHMFDITRTNGLWNALDVANVQGGRGTFGIAPNTATMDMTPQISRSANGNIIFYGWTDNSTYILGAANQTPNLFVRGYNTVTDQWTSVRDVTSCNVTTNGAAFFPKMASELLEPVSGQYKIAALVGIMTSNDPALLANFRFLNNLIFTTADFNIAQPTTTIAIDQGSSYIKCASSAANLSVTGSYSALLWSSGSTINTTSVNTTGTVTVTGRLGCLVGSDTINVIALLADTAGLTDICLNSSTTLSVTGNAISSVWNPGNISGNSATVSPTVTTTYTLTSTGTGGCTETLPITVTVDTARVHASADVSICAGDSVGLSAIGVNTYNWPALSNTNASVNVSPSATTTFVVDGVSSTGCPSSDSVEVIVNPLPVVTLSPDTTFYCPTDSASTCPLPNLAGGIYSGPGVFGSQFDPQAVGAGTYTITYIYTDLNTGCVGTTTAIIVVRLAPVLQVMASATAICAGSADTLTASGASTYLWQPINQTTASVVVSPSTSTTYYLTGTDANGCYANDTLEVQVNELPDVIASISDLFVCEGFVITLSGFGASSYVWNPGNLTGQTVNLAANITTTYTMVGTDAQNCSNIDSVTVVVYPSPNASFSTPATVCLADAPFTITGGSPAGGLYFGPGVNNGIFSPAIAGAGTFQIGYAVTNSDGCYDTALVVYTVDPCIGITENGLTDAMRFYPNPFTNVLIIEGVPVGATLEWTDALGRVVMTSQITREREEIETSTLPAGMYLVRVQHEGQQKQIKLIKE